MQGSDKLVEETERRRWHGARPHPPREHDLPPGPGLAGQAEFSWVGGAPVLRGDLQGREDREGQPAQQGCPVDPQVKGGLLSFPGDFCKKGGREERRVGDVCSRGGRKRTQAGRETQEADRCHREMGEKKVGERGKRERARWSRAADTQRTERREANVKQRIMGKTREQCVADREREREEGRRRQRRGGEDKGGEGRREWDRHADRTGLTLDADRPFFSNLSPAAQR